MTLAILIGAAILLSAGYILRRQRPRYAGVPGWPNPPRPGQNAPPLKNAAQHTEEEKQFVLESRTSPTEVKTKT